MLMVSLFFDSMHTQLVVQTHDKKVANIDTHVHPPSPTLYQGFITLGMTGWACFLRLWIPPM